MIDYVRAYAGRFGVEPILAVLNEHGLGIAPSTFYAHAARGFGPTEAELADAYAANQLHRLWVRNRRLYGRRKLWKTARRAGIDVGRDQVERLMRLAGIDGVRRGKHRIVTTSPTRRHRDTRTTSDVAGGCRHGRISGGSRTSPTCGRRQGSATCRSSPTCSPAASSAGE